MEENQVKIPEGWQEKIFNDFAIKIRSGGTPKSDNLAYYNGNIPFVTIEDITNSNKYLNKTEKQISKEGLNNSAAWLVPEYSLMYSIYATLGVPCINEIEVATNQAILNIITNQKIIAQEFLYYVLLQKRNSILAESSQTTQSNLNAKIVRGLKFVIPKSTTEQRQIATILSKVDEAITQTEQLIAKYQRIKTGLMQDLLTKGIDENGNIRSEETHDFKDSPLGRIPVEWDCLNIGDISNRLRSGVTPRGGSSVYQEEGIMLIRSQNVYSYGFKLEDVAYISEEINSRMLGSELRPFDILLNITGASIGRSTYVPDNHPKSNVNQHVCSIRLHEPSLEKSIFLSTFLNSSYGQDQIQQNNAGSNREGINYTQIKAISIPWFKKEYEFNFFAESMHKAERSIQQYEIQLSKLQSQKTGLMQDLLNGKVRVNHLIKETESV